MPRTARALRILAAGAGVAIVLWLPLSFYYSVWIILPWPGAYGSMTLMNGSASFSTRQENSFITIESAHIQITRLPPHPRSARRALRPTFNRSLVPAGYGVARQTDASIPLWMMAALCLAWPATSLLMRRRSQRRRGFEVQPPAAPSAAPDAEPRYTTASKGSQAIAMTELK